MTVTVLVENSAGDDARLAGEHGLSLHIVHGGIAILHDTGASGLFAENAAVLGIDLSRVDLAVISHGHYDHGGGLGRFFEVNGRAAVFAGCTADEPHYTHLGILRREVGIRRDVFERFRGRFRFIGADSEAAEGVFLLASIGNAHPWVRFNRILLARHDGRVVPDALAHEIAMVVRLPDGLAVFTGCGHRGVLNMVDVARAKFPGIPLLAVIGGFHLGGVPGKHLLVEPDESVRRVGEGLLEREVRMTWTGHCTGERAGRILKEVMGDRVAFLRTGLVIEL